MALVAIATLAACGKNAKPPVSGVAAEADSAEQVIFDGHALMTTAGVKRGEMFADTIFVFNDQSRFVLRHVRAMAEHRAKLEARRARRTAKTARP